MFIIIYENNGSWIGGGFQLAGSSSAAKRYKQSEKARMRNKIAKSTVKTEIRKFQETLKSNNRESAESQLKIIEKLVDTAAGKGLYHKNNAARKKSRLHKALHTIQE